MVDIVVKPCKHDIDRTVPSRTIKLGTHTTYDKRTTPINFQGQRSMSRYTLLLNLVNVIQTEPFQLGKSNLVYILLMTRGRHLMMFKVKGQGHMLNIVVELCKQDKTLLYGQLLRYFPLKFTRATYFATLALLLSVNRRMCSKLNIEI